MRRCGSSPRQREISMSCELIDSKCLSLQSVGKRAARSDLGDFLRLMNSLMRSLMRSLGVRSDKPPLRAEACN